MFPKWKDWNLEYTPKGILRERLRKTLQYGLFVGAVVGAYQLKKSGGSFRDLSSLWGQHFKNALATVLRTIPDRSA